MSRAARAVSRSSACMTVSRRSSSRRSGKVIYTEEFSRFRGTLAMGAYVCKPGDPEAKGIVERAIRYLRRSSCRAARSCRRRRFQRARCTTGSRVAANVRVHQTLRARPIDADRRGPRCDAALPSLMPDVAWRTTVRLGRDHWMPLRNERLFGHPVPSAAASRCASTLARRHREARGWPRSRRHRRCLGETSDDHRPDP